MEPPDGRVPQRVNGRLPAAPIGTGPAPEGAPPAEETIVEVDGLLITPLPGGALALVDSHPDGATSVINLGRRRLEALVPFLRDEGPDESPEKGPVDEGPVEGASDERPVDEGPDEERPQDGTVEGGRPPSESPDGGTEVDWDLYDEQLKAAFLLEQYARGVPPEELPAGWEAVLKALPAALTQRSRRTRTSSGPGAGQPAPGEPSGKA